MGKISTDLHETKKHYDYLFGPIVSWRLGRSLGVDLLSQREKICNFDCSYCQLGPTPYYSTERKLYIPTAEIIREFRELPSDVAIDHITFSGRGEPTLAVNLGEAIREVKILRHEPIAILTNSALISGERVRQDLSQADFVVAKLDATSQEQLEVINNPAAEITFRRIIDGLKNFRMNYQGQLALQIMFIDENKNVIDDFIRLANEIRPDEVQINTPLRPGKVRPLSKEIIIGIRQLFQKRCEARINIVSVYDEKHWLPTTPISSADTLRRRGKPT